ncbi:MAG: polysaccharide deacetylase family protein [Candidatus Muiribacteriota bacterium]
MKKFNLMLIFVLIFVFVSNAEGGFKENVNLYTEYFETLDFFSEKALTLDDHTSDEYFKIYSAGHYIREKVERIEHSIFEYINNNPVNSLYTFKELISETRRSSNHLNYLNKFINENLEILIHKGYADKVNNWSDFILKHTPQRRQQMAPVPSNRILEEINDVFSVDESTQKETRRGRGNYDKRFFRITGNNFLAQSDYFLNPGEIILTFDDGPTNIGDRTRDITNALIDYNFPGIFFVLGSKISSSTNHLLQKQNQIGDVSVHGWNHATPAGKPFTTMSTNAALRDIDRSFNTIKNITGENPGFFRPPYGSITPVQADRIISDYNLVPLGWSIDSQDWSTKNPETLYNNMVNMISKRGKGILLLHDIHEQTRVSFLRLTGWLEENGYTILNPDILVDQFFGDGYNPEQISNDNPNLKFVTANVANIRQAPTTDSEVVAQAQNNTRIEILEEVEGAVINGNNLWYKIKIIYSGKTGYIFSTLVSR